MKNLTAHEIDREILGKIAAEAISKLNPNDKRDARWVNAIGKAVAEIESNPLMTYRHDSRSLLLMSETSGNIYEVDRACGCKAFEFGQPCKHRAAARLIAIYIERTANRIH